MHEAEEVGARNQPSGAALLAGVGAAAEEGNVGSKAVCMLPGLY